MIYSTIQWSLISAFCGIDMYSSTENLQVEEWLTFCFSVTNLKIVQAVKTSLQLAFRVDEFCARSPRTSLPFHHLLSSIVHGSCEHSQCSAFCELPSSVRPSNCSTLRLNSVSETLCFFLFLFRCLLVLIFRFCVYSKSSDWGVLNKTFFLLCCPALIEHEMSWGRLGCRQIWSYSTTIFASQFENYFCNEKTFHIHYSVIVSSFRTFSSLTCVEHRGEGQFVTSFRTINFVYK